MSLFNFKAGQVNYDEETGEALPVRGQGLVVLKKSSEDPSLLAIQWQPRAAFGHTMKSGEELMVLPGDVEFEFVPECTTGRVVSMKFQSSNKRTLYWLQEPAQGDLNFISEDDEAIVTKLNELANEPLDDEEDDLGSEQLPEPEQAPNQAPNSPVEQRALSEQLLAALAEPPRMPDFSPAIEGAHARAQLSQQDDRELLARLARQRLAGLQRSERQEHSEHSQRRGQEQPTERAQPQSLADVFTLPVLTEHITSASDDEIARLLDTVDVASTREELLEVVRSPHFRQSLAQLSRALQVGGGGAISAAAGIPYEGEGISAFLRAIFKGKK